MTIMIVDDNARMRQMIRLLVAHPEDSVVECADGSEAVREYPTVRPDWVLMDIEMEPMNGFEASTAILTGDPAAHIIIVTQHDDSVFRTKARQVGAGGYVLKDRLFDLLSIIRPN
jgi:two-component system, NarL family, invasion response regulator UvrY